MGDIRSSTTGFSRDSNLVTVDPYALVQAILASRAESVATDRTVMDYDDCADMAVSGGDGQDRQPPKPDEPPKNVRVGAANPYALVEAMLGRRIDRNSVNSASLISQVLQTDYDELFDMKNNSVLHAGLQLNEKERSAEQLTEKDMRLLRERDLVTPDLSRVRTLGDLQQIGLRDLPQVRVKHARLTNGKIRLVMEANSNGNRIARHVTNRELTRTLNDLLTPFRLRREDGDPGDGDNNNNNNNDDDDDGDDDDDDGRRGSSKWSPPNGSWRDMYDANFLAVNRRLIDDVTNFSIGDEHRRRARTDMHFFDDPEQGASTNSWFVAALFSVFWANPASINRATRVGNNENNNNNRGEQQQQQQHRLRVRFHDKGGPNNNRTETVEVTYEIPITNSSAEPIYCRASDRTDIWPSLYEKAFAKWISSSSSSNNSSTSSSTSTSSERPDLRVLHAGDPIKCMAQLNGRAPQYFRTAQHPHDHLLGVVRNNCVNNRTINPMCAFTHATGSPYRGANLVANHAYSVCGYAIVGERQYIVLRNPWGVTEPQGLTSYAGILSRMDPELWQPAELLDQGGLFAMETRAFKEAFQYMGVAK